MKVTDATTKSDGGAKAGSSPILASKEEQRPDTHGFHRRASITPAGRAALEQEK